MNERDDSVVKDLIKKVADFCELLGDQVPEERLTELIKLTAQIQVAEILGEKLLFTQQVKSEIYNIIKEVEFDSNLVLAKSLEVIDAVSNTIDTIRNISMGPEKTEKLIKSAKQFSRMDTGTKSLVADLEMLYETQNATLQGKTIDKLKDNTRVQAYSYAIQAPRAHQVELLTEFCLQKREQALAQQREQASEKHTLIAETQSKVKKKIDKLVASVSSDHPSDPALNVYARIVKSLAGDNKAEVVGSAEYLVESIGTDIGTNSKLYRINTADNPEAGIILRVSKTVNDDFGNDYQLIRAALERLQDLDYVLPDSKSVFVESVDETEDVHIDLMPHYQNGSMLNYRQSKSEVPGYINSDEMCIDVDDLILQEVSRIEDFTERKVVMLDPKLGNTLLDDSLTKVLQDLKSSRTIESIKTNKEAIDAGITRQYCE